MRKIIVPTDFSENALAAATYAAFIATKNEAVLYLLHAMEGAADPILEPAALDTQSQERHTRQQFDRLTSLKRQIAGRNKHLRIELRLVRGMAAEAVLFHSQNEQTDLIVMGAHGSSRLKELLIGSTTASVISRSKIPVMVVPADYHAHECGTILFTTKKFSEDKSLLNALIAAAGTFGASIDVVSFVNEGTAKTASFVNVSRHLVEYVDHLKQIYPGTVFNSHQLTGADLMDSIEQYGRQREVGMIAVFNHPRSLIEKLCKPNNTKGTVFRSHIPVLVLPGE